MAKSNQELTDALSAPVGEFIAAVGKGLADAQQAMDMNTIEAFRSVYMGDESMLEELRRLGYQPNWYKIPELTAEINMALSISATALETGRQRTLGRANKFTLLAAPVDASYINNYNYDIQGASKVKFTIVPVPPSAQAEQLKVMPFFAEDKVLEEILTLLKQLEIPFLLRMQSDQDQFFTETELRENRPAVFGKPVHGFDHVAGAILAPGVKVIIVLSDSVVS